MRGLTNHGVNPIEFTLNRKSLSWLPFADNDENITDFVKLNFYLFRTASFGGIRITYQSLFLLRQRQ